MNGIKLLRLGKIPLVLALLFSLGLIIRVPLSAKTTNDKPLARNNQQAKQDKGKKNRPYRNAQRELEQPDNQNVIAQDNPLIATIVIGSPDEENPGTTFPAAANLTEEPLASIGAAIGAQVATLVDIQEAIPKIVGGDGNVANDEPAAGTPTPADLPPEVNVELPFEVPQPNEAIVLSNPADSGGPIKFVVGKRQHTLAPGEELTLKPGKSYRLRFHRGGSFGIADETLTESGVFQFTPTRDGWVLGSN